MKSNKVVGLWSGHDTSCCLLENGVPTLHIELERYIREKEPAGDSVKLFFDNVDIDVGDIEYVSTCYFDDPVRLKLKDHNLDDKLVVCGHHTAHAAHAYYSSKFDDAIIFSFDGGGIEKINGKKHPVSTAVFVGNKNKIELDEKSASWAALNVGGVWTRCTRYIFGFESGWPQGHQAGTVMALAALGDPQKYIEDFRTFFKESSLAHLTPSGHVKGMSAKDPRRPRHPYLGKWEDIAKVDDQEKYNMAAALQLATEEVVRDCMNYFLHPNLLETKSKNICLTGGVALNSVLTGKILEWFPDCNVYIPPAPYDGGLSIGSAQYVWHHVLGNKKVNWEDNVSPYLGKTYSSVAVMNALYKFAPLDIFYTEDVDDSRVIQLLDEGNVISVFNGSSESGRRALGNRSILADPRKAEMKDHVNEKVKHRQWFRPFAPSILKEEVKNWFQIDQDSPYMGFVLKFKEEKKALVPAVVHFDGTARLQTVTEASNKWYYEFLKKWCTVSGVPLLLNTSFNDREPICETPWHALKCFIGTDIDYLYFVDSKILVSKIK